jgi:hypothetical protein
MLVLVVEFRHMTMGVRYRLMGMLVAVLADDRLGVVMVMVAVIMAMPVLMGFHLMDRWVCMLL